MGISYKIQNSREKKKILYYFGSDELKSYARNRARLIHTNKQTRTDSSEQLVHCIKFISRDALRNSRHLSRVRCMHKNFERVQPTQLSLSRILSKVVFAQI